VSAIIPHSYVYSIWPYPNLNSYGKVVYSIIVYLRRLQLRLRPEPEVDLAGAPGPAGGLFRTSGRSLDLRPDLDFGRYFSAQCPLVFLLPEARSFRCKLPQGIFDFSTSLSITILSSGNSQVAQNRQRHAVCTRWRPRANAVAAHGWRAASGERAPRCKILRQRRPYFDQYEPCLATETSSKSINALFLFYPAEQLGKPQTDQMSRNRWFSPRGVETLVLEKKFRATTAGCGSTSLKFASNGARRFALIVKSEVPTVHHASSAVSYLSAISLFAKQDQLWSKTLIAASSAGSCSKTPEKSARCWCWPTVFNVLTYQQWYWQRNQAPLKNTRTSTTQQSRIDIQKRRYAVYFSSGEICSRAKFLGANYFVFVNLHFILNFETVILYRVNFHIIVSNEILH